MHSTAVILEGREHSGDLVNVGENAQPSNQIPTMEWSCHENIIQMDTAAYCGVNMKNVLILHSKYVIAPPQSQKYFIHAPTILAALNIPHQSARVPPAHQ